MAFATTRERVIVNPLQVMFSKITSPVLSSSRAWLFRTCGCPPLIKIIAP